VGRLSRRQHGFKSHWGRHLNNKVASESGRLFCCLPGRPVSWTSSFGEADNRDLCVCLIAFHPVRTRKQKLVSEGMQRITLRHHRGTFVGCFSIRLKKNVNSDLFKNWKVTRNPSITNQMARESCGWCDLGKRGRVMIGICLPFKKVKGICYNNV
jgi:hypothetical protein